MNLNQSSVIFDKDFHRYFNEYGIELSGLSPVIEMLFPDTYKDIPKYILNNAAKYGTSIHEKCQKYDMFESEPDCIEVQNYRLIKEEYGLIHIDSEYLVSDDINLATQIDKVYYVSDNDVDLADIKTTSLLHIDRLEWQLSIGAYLFELQNPFINICKLYAIRLRKDLHEFINIERKADKEVIEVINKYLKLWHTN